MSRPGRVSRGEVASALASLALIISALWLPWSTYRTPALTISFTSGHLGLVLVLCGVASIASTLLLRWWKRSGVHWIQFGLGCVALAFTVALAMSRIADANRIAIPHHGVTATSYAIGAQAAIVASMVMIGTSVARRTMDGTHNLPSTGPSREAAALR